MQEHHSTRSRRGFITKSILFFIIFLSLTTAQLFLAIHFENKLTLFKDNVSLCAIFFGVGLFHFLIYFFVESIRSIDIFNWLMAFFIVECLTLAVISTATSLSFWQLTGSILTALCLVIFFFVIAAFIKFDFTLDVVFLYVFSYGFCIGTVYFLTLYAVAKLAFAICTCLGIIIVVVFTFNLYFDQCIIGGFFTEVRLSDYILAALTIYVNFFLIFLISMNFATLIILYLEN